VCFEKNAIKNPGEILFYACALIRYWLGLYLEESKKDYSRCRFDDEYNAEVAGEEGSEGNASYDQGQL
jgi:hypothetical protein